MGGSGGGIPRLFDNRIASAIAMLDTAWIIATGSGLFCLCSSIILETSSFFAEHLGPTFDTELCD